MCCIRKCLKLLLTAFFLQTCSVTNSTVMKCLTPEVDLPPAFKNWENETSTAGSQHPSSGESVNDGNVTPSPEDPADKTVKINDQTLDFYLGFKLDGVTKYKNLSDTKDLIEYSQIKYYTVPPKIERTEFVPFVPFTNMTITIKVCYF